MRSDEITKNYIRRTYSLLEFLGDIGGIHEILFVILGSLIRFMIERNFNAKLVSDLYKVQKYAVDQSEYYPAQSETNEKKNNILQIPEENNEDGGVLKHV